MIIVKPAELPLSWAVALGAGAVLGALLLTLTAKMAPSDGVKPRKIHSLGTSIPIIGDLLEVIKHADERHDWMTAQSRRFNFEPWQIKNPGSQPIIVVADPAVYEAVATTQFDTFVKGAGHRDILQDVLGGGFVNLDGDEWYHGRKLAAKFFSAKTLRLMMSQTMKRNMRQVFSVLDPRVGSGELADISLLFHQFNLQTFMEVGVGVDFPVIGNDKPLPFEITLGESLPIAASRRLVPASMWKLARWLNIGKERINELIVESLAKQRDETDAHANEGRVRSAVELFAEHSRADQVGLRPQDLADFVINFVLAANDTSSLATAWFFYALSQHPEVEAKVREELQAKLPALGVQTDDYVTVDHVKQLVYLEAVIKETLRFYPTGPIMMRQCSKDTVVDGDLFIRKGQSVTISIYAMARNPKMWGPDAAEFKPERWIGASGELLSFPSTKFATFSTGPRICIGMSLAMLNLRIMVANLLHRYRFAYAENDGSYRNSIGLLMKHPLRVQVQRA